MSDKPLAWIVGGSRGIGFACAEALGAEGYSIALSSKTKTMLNESAVKLREHGIDVTPFICDITQEKNVTSTYSDIKRVFGRVPDVLINSAGISPWSTFTETSSAEFDEVIAINTRGMFLTSREVLAD